jgi:hypothetical protein
MTLELKLPVLLFVLQVTVPIGLDPETVAVQVTGEPATAGLGEQETDTLDECCPSELKAYTLPSNEPM